MAIIKYQNGKKVKSTAKKKSVTKELKMSKSEITYGNPKNGKVLTKKITKK